MISFKVSVCIIQDKTNALIAKIKMQGNNFYLKLVLLTEHVLTASLVQTYLWHRRLAHYNYTGLKFMHEKGFVQDLPKVSNEKKTCQSCALGNLHSLPFPKNTLKGQQKDLN